MAFYGWFAAPAAGAYAMRRAIIGLTVAIAFSVANWTTSAVENPDKDRPAALVESITSAPGAGVGFLDYVFPGQVVELGPDGIIVLSYFATCLVETVRGGRITVDVGLSKVDGGEVKTEKVPCQGANITVTSATGEAGASVTRVTPFQGQDWSEWTTRSRQPIFKWARAGVTTVAVIDLDTEPPETVWTGTVDGSHIAYPADARPLRIGVPYEVRVSIPDTRTLKAVFSIDPDLEGPDTALGRVVPVGR